MRNACRAALIKEVCLKNCREKETSEAEATF
jgi:hypothetical protein